MEQTGLTTQEVEQKIKEGKVNRQGKKGTRTVGGIIFSNVFTYFNLIFAILAGLLISVGSYKNLTFLIVVIANMVIGIIQQLRAKRVLDKLSLLDVTTYQVLRDGKETEVRSDRLVEGDVILLQDGQQIPADAEVVLGEASANESLLTGEPDEVPKKEGSELRSGSFIVSGRCLAKLTKVGAESYAAELTRKARKVEEHPAEMIRDIERIIKVAGILIIPVGALLLYQAVHVNGSSIHDGIVSMVAAVVGMIPEGMYLLATIALALSAARLAEKQVLLHDMRSIETLARVDVLCVDKTGTITTNEMEVTECASPKQGSKGEPVSREEAEKILASYVQTVPDSNITMQALRAYCGDAPQLETLEVLPFSSKKKFSEVTTKQHVYRLGAPEYLLNDIAQRENRALLRRYEGEGLRVLALTRDWAPILFITLRNQIRENAPSTFAWFEDRGVEVKVISGDNPLTVSKVAARAGIKDADRYVDATGLVSEEQIEDAVTRYTVFGRVKPEQKKQIVEALHKVGKKVAMTGDGVNDILAMKEADCSIAMGGGSDAARQAAQVVLLDSDFSRMTDIVGEGRRDINNITRSATLFLYKNIFSLLLAIFSIIHTFTYPLVPNQVSLISMFNIGIPAFLLALEDNQTKQEGNFIRTTILHSMPAALTSFFSIAFMVLFGRLFNISSSDVSTASTYLLAVIGFLILWQISRPANWYHVAVIALCIIGMIVCSTSFWFIFDLTDISAQCAALCGVFAIAEVTIMNWLTWIFERLGKLRKPEIRTGRYTTLKR